MTVRYIDLFAGIGGFHATASSLGWTCVFASEIDKAAAAVYQNNWGINPLNDITDLANDNVMNIPDHDVLFAGFPCQPFSKSGKQLGMDETRGTLFWNILKIVESKRPSLVVLENVRNISGPQHRHEWEIIIRELRNLHYRVASKPFIVSPHKIRRDAGGRPQIRERVFIVATHIGSKNANLPEFFDIDLEIPQDAQLFDPQIWNLKTDLPLDVKPALTSALRKEEVALLRMWDELVKMLLVEREQAQLPGFPLWTDFWNLTPQSDEFLFPLWKQKYIEKNRKFYEIHKKTIDNWIKRNPEFLDLPPSRRKLEWQAQDAKSIWETVIHLRPSGIRVKKATYVPALVAITQTSIVGSEKRRLTLEETARLQGLPSWFDLGGQPQTAAFKQLGNGVSIGVAYQVLRAVSERDKDLLEKTCPQLLRDLLGAPRSPDPLLESLKD